MSSLLLTIMLIIIARFTGVHYSKSLATLNDSLYDGAIAGALSLVTTYCARASLLSAFHFMLEYLISKHDRVNF